MRAAVGHRDVYVWVLQPLRGDIVAPVVGRMGEFSLQFLVEGDVQEGVQRMLALGLGDVGYAQALILQVALVGDLDHLQPAPVGARVRTVDDILFHALAHAVLRQLGDALLLGADQRLHPVGHVVEQIVLGELELGDRRHRPQLREHGQTLGLNLVQPIVALIVAQHHMERPPAHPHHLGQHVALAGPVVGYANGPPQVSHTELGQHLRQRQELLFGGYVAGQPAAVFGPVLQVLVSRNAESAGLHGIVEYLLHLV